MYMGNIRKLLVLAAVILMISSGMISYAADGTGGQGHDWHKGAGIAQWLDVTEIWSEIPTMADPDADKAEEVQVHDRTGELVMADVNRKLNVRAEPNENGEKLGYLYADCGGTILEQSGEWTKILSGELEGWAHNDYLLFGEDAQQLAKEVGITIARTTTEALRIRKAPSLDAGVYDLLEEGAEYVVMDEDQLAFSDGIELSDEWIAVDYEGVTGFVSAQYIETEFIIGYGETMQQVKEREEAEATLLLAAVIQCEAGNQPYDGQVAVGAVVMNRVKSSAYPNTIEGVVYAKGQFTPVGSGRVDRLLAEGNIRKSCMNAAMDALVGISPVGGALHFRRADGRNGIIIGNHVFW